jgi:penicillin-binding protein 2
VATDPGEHEWVDQRLPAPRLHPVEPLTTVSAGFFRSAGFYARVGVLGTLGLAVFSVLLLRLWALQVVHGPTYRRVATAQEVRLLEQPGPRGVIVDHAGRVLAGTQGSLVVVAEPRVLGRVVGAKGAWRPSAPGRRVLERLAAVSGQEPGRLVAAIRSGLRRAPWAPTVTVARVPRLLAFYMQERSDEFPGLRIAPIAVRRYPQGALGGEFLGLVGEISAAQLHEQRYRGYRPGELIGRSGVEAAYDRVLQGGLQRSRVLVDALGRPVSHARRIGRTRHPGGLRLTIDARLQRAALRAIRDGIGFARATGHLDADAGAAVVMNARTGAVYALASYPGFSEVAAARDPHYLARLLAPTNPSRQLLDRAVQGLYPAGSTFKPIVAAAALASGVISPWTALPCTGSLTVGNTVFHNVEPGINAILTLPQALEISCDTWFYRLGLALYQQRAPVLQRWARLLGIGHPTGVDLPGEAAGNLPPALYAGDEVNLAIGQGRLLVTPLQLAVAYAALANGGTVVRPHLANAVLSSSGALVRRLRFPAHTRLRLPGLAAIHDGLFRAAHDPGGTSAAIFAGFPISVAGKTGTAQAPSGSDHSWYASWAPAGNPRVVVVVLIEHGGFGAQAAAPAARELYSAVFRLRGGQRGP